MSKITEDIRAKASIYYGNDICQEKKQELLMEAGLPDGLLPLQDVEECGFVEETGFVWLKQKKKTDHRFEKIGKLVSYATEVSAYAEPCRIRQLNGVKAKELLFWVTITEITIPSPNGDKVTFKSAAGPSRTFPADAFYIEGKGARPAPTGLLQRNGIPKLKVQSEVKEVVKEAEDAKEVRAGAENGVLDVNCQVKAAVVVVESNGLHDPAAEVKEV